MTQAKRATGCIFCDKPAEQNDREHFILKRGDHCFIILNAFPYSNGHLMVAPYRHTADLNELTDPELLEIQHMVRCCVNLLKRAFNPDGFNLGVNIGLTAGAGIKDHIHWHIVPRWNGDTNFMPVLADVRVIPQSLDDTWQCLHAILQSDADELSG